MTGTLQIIAEVLGSFLGMVLMLELSGSLLVGIVVFILFLVGWHYHDKSKDLEKKLKEKNLAPEANPKN